MRGGWERKASGWPRGWVTSWVGWERVSKGEATARSPLGTKRSACPQRRDFLPLHAGHGAGGHAGWPVDSTVSYTQGAGLSPRAAMHMLLAVLVTRAGTSGQKPQICTEVGRGAQEGLPLRSVLTVPASPSVLPVPGGARCLPQGACRRESAEPCTPGC